MLATGDVAEGAPFFPLILYNIFIYACFFRDMRSRLSELARKCEHHSTTHMLDQWQNGGVLYKRNRRRSACTDTRKRHLRTNKQKDKHILRLARAILRGGLNDCSSNWCRNGRHAPVYKTKIARRNKIIIQKQHIIVVYNLRTHTSSALKTSARLSITYARGSCKLVFFLTVQ